MNIRKIVCLLLIFSNLILFPQKEANIWYFGSYAGLDFNVAPPNPLDGMFSSQGSCASISDNEGNFLFATDAEAIYNRNGQIMLNGNNLKGSDNAAQGALIVQKPRNEDLYYVFTTAYALGDPIDYGLYYSVVDMTLDDGLGGVTSEKNVLLVDAWDAADKISGIKHENGEDIWVITRKFADDGFASFLLTKDGINATSVFSSAIDRPFDRVEGNLKISQNKKYLVAAYRTEQPAQNLMPDFEICKFNAITGQVELMYTLRIGAPGTYREPFGVEFSPDSKLVYLSVFGESTGNIMQLYQFDVNYIEDSTTFISSKIHIADGPVCGLQLARDGKIYCTTDSYAYYNDYISVIHEPWKNGLLCNYEADAVFLGTGKKVGQFLPNILLDYLYRFEWEGNCQSSPFIFQHNFQPEPVFISWDFDDPASGTENFSNELNPEHLFSAPGEYEVDVYVKYPSGRIEETSRVVTVEDIPHPSLGPGYTICQGEEIILYAGDEEGMYAWSTGQFGQNLNEITVSDSGWYWVRVTAEAGCFGIDSVRVNWYPKAGIDETNLQLIPTTCGGNNGKILGLAVSGEEPLSVEWFDADSNFLSNTLDLSGLGVGNYFLHILDGNGCTTISPAYTIEDAGDIEIASVDWQDTHCNQNLGAITITTATGDPLSLLFSIDNGSSWQSGNPLFENLPAGNYFVRVKDLSGCESVFENNPVVVENIAGPEVNSVTTLPENDYLQNGQIDLLATSSEGDVHFSIDGGNSFQTGDGLFTNLSAGSYTCVVKDDFGCDTTFSVEVTRVISQLIEAIAGNGTTCIGNAAVVPIKLNNFSNIFKFHVKLTYDTTLLSCDGYINLNPDLANNIQVSIIPETDEVIVSWEGESAVTLDENATMLELVFGAKKEGISSLDWAAQAGESAFYNENLEEITAYYHLGLLRVYTRPRILMNKEEAYCAGDSVFTYVVVVDGSGEIDYQWTGPDGYSGTSQFLEIENVSASQAGVYTLKATDTLQCDDEKQVEIIINPDPVISFPVEDTIVASPGFILEAGSGYESYLWNTGDTTEKIQIQNEGLYSVEVTSQASCKSTDSVTVLWGGEPFWLPNAFTPDGDGLNDTFKPVERYDMVKSYNLTVYNRWGQLIFETSDIAQGWDGTYLGNPAEQGSYIYKIVFTAYPDYQNQQVVTGNVVLVR